MMKRHGFHAFSHFNNRWEVVQAKRLTKRIFIIDWWRGLAILGMLVHHTCFDLIHIWQKPWGIFIEADWFQLTIHPFIIASFVGLAGFSCSLSKRPFKRCLRLSLVAVLITVVSLGIEHYLGAGYVMIFQVLHLLAVCSLFYAFFRQHLTAKVWLLIALFCFCLNRYSLSWLGADQLPGWLLPLGMGVANAPNMGDYLPLFPWAGWFCLGVWSAKCYREKLASLDHTLQMKYPFLRRSLLAWMGKHALPIYLIHQPLLLLALYLIGYLFRW